MKISIHQLTREYPGGVYALRDVDLEIGNGLFGLLGPNGAGKTTLMSILVTLLKPTSGQVTIDGYDLQMHRGEIRKMIGYLPQEFHTFSKLATWEFLDYAARLSGLRRTKERRARVDQLLEDVGLFDARDRMAGKLSGGMKRRLGIAQSLVGDAKILIVDEPTVGLDPQERLRFRSLMADLSLRDMIIILSTHIVGDISSTCQDMALLHHGRIRFNGPPARLMENARRKVWTVTVSDEDLDRVKSTYPVISAIPAERGYELRLVAERVEGLEAGAAEPNLEDAYIHFMQSAEQGMDLEALRNGW